MLRFTLAALILALAACHDHPQTPVDRIVTVKVPVAVQPIKPSDVPAVPAPLGPRPPSLQQQADALFAKWCEAVAYFLKADPALRLSAGETQQPLPAYPECESGQ